MQRQRLYSPEGAITAFFMIILVIAVAVQVIGRVFGGFGPVWTEEFSRWIWIWMVFVGLAEVERTRTSLRMDFVVQLLPPRMRVGLSIFVDILFCAVLIHLIQIGIGMVMRTMSYSAVAMPVPTAWLYAAFPVGGILIVIRVAARAIGDARALASGQVSKDYIT